MPNSANSEFVRAKISQIESHRDAEIERAREIAKVEIHFWNYGEPTQNRSNYCQESTKDIVARFHDTIERADRRFFTSKGYRAGPYSRDEEEVTA